MVACSVWSQLMLWSLSWLCIYAHVFLYSDLWFGMKSFHSFHCTCSCTVELWTHSSFIQSLNPYTLIICIEVHNRSIGIDAIFYVPGSMFYGSYVSSCGSPCNDVPYYYLVKLWQYYYYTLRDYIYAFCCQYSCVLLQSSTWNIYDFYALL